MPSGYRVFAQASLSSLDLPCSVIYETRQEALDEQLRLRDLVETKGNAALLPMFERYCSALSGEDRKTITETSGFAFFTRPADFEAVKNANGPSLRDAIEEAVRRGE